MAVFRPNSEINGISENSKNFMAILLSVKNDAYRRMFWGRRHILEKMIFKGTVVGETLAVQTLAVFSNLRQPKNCQYFADDCSWPTASFNIS